MAGYFIYSLDWNKFRNFVDSPTPAQLLAFAKQVSDRLDTNDQNFEASDPMRDWPSEPEKLCDILKQRIAQPDWYGDLSDTGKTVWDFALTDFCERKKPNEMGFRAEGEGIYFDVIELIGRHHGLRGRMTDAIISHFGTRPYRYQPPDGKLPGWGDWMPYHSMHTPEEVQRLLQELKEAGAAIDWDSHEDARRDYEEELLPAVEKVARAGRMLYIGVDT